MRALAAALLAASLPAASSGGAHVIVRKDIVSAPCTIDGAKLECVVENQATEVRYSVFNVGESTAYGVEISDSSLDESFALEGKLDGGVGEIAKGENKTVVATVKPKSSGELSLGAAEVSYQSTAEGGRQTGYSTQPSGYVVETERAHRKRTAIHYWEWTFYAVAAGLAVGLPGTAYQQQGS